MPNRMNSCWEKETGRACPRAHLDACPSQHQDEIITLTLTSAKYYYSQVILTRQGFRQTEHNRGVIFKLGHQKQTWGKSIGHISYVTQACPATSFSKMKIFFFFPRMISSGHQHVLPPGGLQKQSPRIKFALQRSSPSFPVFHACSPNAKASNYKR